MTTRTRRVPAPPVAALVAAGLILGATPSHAAQPARAARPDLVVTQAKLDRASVVEGGSFKVTHTLANTGKGEAGASRTRFYLTTDVAGSMRNRATGSAHPRTSPTDLLLAGTVAVPAVRPDQAKAVRAVSLTVPLGTAAGRYTVLACGDDLGDVTESDEARNCKAATPQLTVTAAPGTAGLQIHQYADTFDEEVTDLDLGFVKAFCRSVIPPRRLTLAAALGSARATLTSTAGADALTRVARSGLARTTEESQLLAAAATSQGSPGLALAALLRAHDLDPHNATVLVDAAAMATAVGLPNEALAMLDGAAGLTAHRPAMGISLAAQSLLVRGNALVLTGRASAAAPLFGQVRQQAPLLSEADAGLGTVEACRGHDALAQRYLRLSKQRTQHPKKATEDPTKPEPVRPGPVLDLGQGKASTLRHLPVAGNTAQGVAIRPLYLEIQERFADEITGSNAEEEQLQQRLDATDELISDAERDRRDSLMSLSFLVGDRPDVQHESARVSRVVDDLTDLREGFFGGGTGEAPSTYGTLADEADEACAGAPNYSACRDKTMKDTCRPALTSAHAQWNQLMGEAQQAADAYYAGFSTAVSSYAANLADADANRLVLLGVEAAESSTYATLVQQAVFWTHYLDLYQDDCVTPAQTVSEAAPGVTPAATSGACPTALTKIAFTAELGPTKIEVGCEKIKQKIKNELIPLVELFAEVEYNIRTGQVTVVGGAKLGGKVGGGVDAGFKSAAYLTTDGRGGIKDLGWRVGPTVKVVRGPVEVTVYKDEMDLSFLPGLLNGT